MIDYTAGEASKFVPVTLEQVIERDITFMSKNKGRPKRTPKSSFLRRLFGIEGPTPAAQIQARTDLTEEDDGFFGLLDPVAARLNLGLKVYTKSEKPAVIVGRILGEF